MSGRAGLNNPEKCIRKIKTTILDDFFVQTFYTQILGIKKYDIVFEPIKIVKKQYICE